MKVKIKKRILCGLLTTKVLSSIYLVTPNTSDEDYWKMVENHKGKLMIEYMYSYADEKGTGGYTESGGYTAYNKKVKPGKKVLTITVLNPANNYEDDYIAIYDNGMWR